MPEDIESVLNGFQADYVCEKCKHSQKVNIFPYINFAQNPEYYALVKDLSIFKVKCEECKTEKVIQFDTLIIDETHKYLLYLLTDRSLANRFKHQIKYFVEAVLNKDDKYDFSEYKSRLVFSPNELVEKMAIFETGLNDEIIEIIKCGIYDKNLVNRSIYDCMFFDGLVNADLKFVIFSSKSASKEPQNFVMKHEFYNKLIDDLSGLKNRHQYYFEEINEDWVRSKFTDSTQENDK